jgi:hypothetical protein
MRPVPIDQEALYLVCFLLLFSFRTSETTFQCTTIDLQVAKSSQVREPTSAWHSSTRRAATPVRRARLCRKDLALAMDAVVPILKQSLPGARPPASDAHEAVALVVRAACVARGLCGDADGAAAPRQGWTDGGDVIELACANGPTIKLLKMGPVLLVHGVPRGKHAIRNLCHQRGDGDNLRHTPHHRVCAHISLCPAHAPVPSHIAQVTARASAPLA